MNFKGSKINGLFGPLESVVMKTTDILRCESYLTAVNQYQY